MNDFSEYHVRSVSFKRTKNSDWELGFCISNEHEGKAVTIGLDLKPAPVYDISDSCEEMSAHVRVQLRTDKEETDGNGTVKKLAEERVTGAKLMDEGELRSGITYKVTFGEERETAICVLSFPPRIPYFNALKLSAFEKTPDEISVHLFPFLFCKVEHFVVRKSGIKDITFTVDGGFGYGSIDMHIMSRITYLVDTILGDEEPA